MCLTWINTYNMDKKTIYLDRNEYNYGPAPEVGEVLKNFDPNKLCFYTRIYDEGKKSILSDYLSQVYDIPEKQIILGYGGEDILKQVVHCFLAGKEKQKTLLIPKFSWWYYKSIADEVEGRSVLYPLYEEGNTFKYDFKAMQEAVEREKPEMVLIASPNNPTGNSLTAEELDKVLSFIDPATAVVIDEAYASFANQDTSYQTFAGKISESTDCPHLIQILRASRIAARIRIYGHFPHPLFKLQYKIPGIQSPV